eukprot:Skav215568  [mRNA]  locus=scaffold2748:32953:38206:+ [translate_table: standard]
MLMRRGQLRKNADRPGLHRKNHQTSKLDLQSPEGQSSQLRRTASPADCIRGLVAKVLASKEQPRDLPLFLWEVFECGSVEVPVVRVLAAEADVPLDKWWGSMCRFVQTSGPTLCPLALHRLWQELRKAAGVTDLADSLGRVAKSHAERLAHKRPAPVQRFAIPVTLAGCHAM